MDQQGIRIGIQEQLAGFGSALDWQQPTTKEGWPIVSGHKSPLAEWAADALRKFQMETPPVVESRTIIQAPPPVMQEYVVQAPAPVYQMPIAYETPVQHEVTRVSTNVSTPASGRIPLHPALLPPRYHDGSPAQFQDPIVGDWNSQPGYDAQAQQQWVNQQQQWADNQGQFGQQQQPWDAQGQQAAWQQQQPQGQYGQQQPQGQGQYGQQQPQGQWDQQQPQGQGQYGQQQPQGQYGQQQPQGQYGQQPQWEQQQPQGQYGQQQPQGQWDQQQPQGQYGQQQQPQGQQPQGQYGQQQQQPQGQWNTNQTADQWNQQQQPQGQWNEGAYSTPYDGSEVAPRDMPYGESHLSQGPSGVSGFQDDGNRGIDDELAQGETYVTRASLAEGEQYPPYYPKSKKARGSPKKKKNVGCCQ